MNPIKIGIAGYMGSGKSTCAMFLSRKGGTVINADTVAKEIMNADAEIKKKLIKSFGNTILSEDKILFDMLGEICFRSLDNLLRLNNIVHPQLIDRLHSMVTASDGKLCILDAALISYWHIEKWFDVVYWIQASKEIRFQRLMQKAELSTDELLRRMECQEELFSEPAEGEWIIISNDGTLEEFEKAIEESNSINHESFTSN